jgi:hypothetical protein
MLYYTGWRLSSLQWLHVWLQMLIGGEWVDGAHPSPYLQ